MGGNSDPRNLQGLGNFRAQQFVLPPGLEQNPFIAHLAALVTGQPSIPANVSPTAQGNVAAMAGQPASAAALPPSLQPQATGAPAAASALPPSLQQAAPGQAPAGAQPFGSMNMPAQASPAYANANINPVLALAMSAAQSGALPPAIAAMFGFGGGREGGGSGVSPALGIGGPGSGQSGPGSGPDISGGVAEAKSAPQEKSIGNNMSAGTGGLSGGVRGS